MEGQKRGLVLRQIDIELLVHHLHRVHSHLELLLVDHFCLEQEPVVDQHPLPAPLNREENVVRQGEIEVVGQLLSQQQLSVGDDPVRALQVLVRDLLQKRLEFAGQVPHILGENALDPRHVHRVAVLLPEGHAAAHDNPILARLIGHNGNVVVQNFDKFHPHTLLFRHKKIQVSQSFHTTPKLLVLPASQ